MTSKEKPTIRKINRRYQITIPPRFRERFHLEVGDHLEIEEDGDRLVISPLDLRRRQVAEELHQLFEDAEGSEMTEEEAMELAIREIKESRRERKKDLSPEKA
ncbi:MAG: AbrB/MazE/SpoVT family DNA-binding domain-containing protein [bacterium]|nr:AbrB/MazE/SpoVT family DNA-binding domain-containing protein [bacterium]